jgi:integrase
VARARADQAASRRDLQRTTRRQACARPTDHALYATAICTGLRIGELLALRWQDVDLERGHLTVVTSKTEAGTGRQVDLWRELHEELASYRDLLDTGPDAYVFSTWNGRADTSSNSNISKRLKRAVLRANEELARHGQALIATELSPHSLRRTFASLLYLRGENPVYVMQQMGHSDPKLALQIYARVIGRQHRRAPGSRLLRVLDGVSWEQPSDEQARGVSIAAL